jgi:hypothetical protein
MELILFLGMVIGLALLSIGLITGNVLMVSISVLCVILWIMIMVVINQIVR